jgi:polyribonucleotide nucleotidyltransferase
MQKKVFETEFAGKTLILETGDLARQASGSCTVRYGDTVVLATAVMGGVRDGVDYFPLSVEYEEKLYAAGKIKGSRWIKREGRPSDEAILTGRLIDRCIRPLFPKELKNEVQVIVTVLSFDQENDCDVLGLIAASAALMMSNVPWNGPLAGTRIIKENGSWVLNPTFAQREEAPYEMFVSGMNKKLLMVEAEGLEISEQEAYEAIEHSLNSIEPLIDFIKSVTAEVGLPKAEIVNTEEEDQEVVEKANDWIKKNVPAILFDAALKSKIERKQAVGRAKEELSAHLETEGIGKDRRKKAFAMLEAFVDVEISRAIIEEQKRVDGRRLDEIRALESRASILPRTHGSALFSRGETQVLSVVTLGSPGDEQFLDGLEDSSKKRFMHHYNFPPFSVGEVGRMSGPGRREIGHGALAEKALRPMMPEIEDFPYTVRVVSEVLGSNGSSSMGSVCGSSMALMDAGVPLKKPVAGIAMGLASNEEAGKYTVLTDLQDLEDGNGGMDFKIAGTKDGITAIQLDTKTTGIPLDIVKQTLDQGKVARLQILDVMAQAITEPRAEMSPYAPRIISFKINPDKIREVIGPGGKVINKIIEETGVQIDIEQDGSVNITAREGDKADEAVAWIKNLTREIMAGEVFEGKVSRMFDFGAMVEILPGQEGMVHVSELDHKRVEKVTDVINLGDTVKVKVINIDDKGRVNLSIKALLPMPEGMEQSYDRGPRPPRPQNRTPRR